MHTLIQVGKTPVKLDEIVRSLADGPDYYPHWRFRICEHYLIRIRQAPDESSELRDILSSEKDPFVRQLVLFASGRASVIAASIDYALRCHRSQHKNRIARTISAMVVAGRSSSEIAEEMGTSPAHIIAYEKIFFDVRRYLPLKSWIKNLCYFSSSVTGLGDDASRWLITAYERGWDALVFTFSISQSDPISKGAPNPAGKRVSDRILLGILARLADFISALEMNGVTPNAEQVEPLLKMALLVKNLSPTLSRLDYPTALGPKEEKERREAAELVGKLSLAARRRITAVLERIQHSPEIGQEGQNKPPGSP